MQLPRRRRRFLGLAILLGLSLLLLTIPVYDIWADATNPHKTLVSTLFENSFPTVMAGLLLGGTVSLHRREWDGDEMFRVAKWASAAVVVAILLMVWVVGIQHIQNDLKPHIIAGNAIIAASVAGLAIGMYDVGRTRRREQLAIERDHLSALYENTSDCIVTFRHRVDGPYVDEVNQTFTSLFDRDVEAILEEAVATDGTENVHESVWQSLRDRESFSTEIQAPIDHGSETRDFILRTVPTNNQHTYLVFTDITDQKERERLLEERERELERETTRREEELEQRTNQLRFLHSILRHDVQNGMMVIQSRAGFIAEQVDGKLQKYAETIESRSVDISDQIDRMRLTLDTLTTDDWATEHISATEVLRERGEALQRTYRDTTVSIDVPDGLVVEADEMLEDIVDNLLENAVQHNDSADPTVAVSARDEGDTVRIEVEDNGPGIPDDRREEVFRRGVTSTTESSDSGSGFGLFFVDTMVDAYGGDIWVEDSDLDGARFVVELQSPDEEDPGETVQGGTASES